MRLLNRYIVRISVPAGGGGQAELLLPWELWDVESRVFHYSNISAYLVGAALEKVLGEHLISYLTLRLFQPLKIEKPIFGNCPRGHFYGASAIELTVEELSRLGHMETATLLQRVNT